MKWMPGFLISLLALGALAEDGVALEAGTQRPMSGAIVMAVWWGRSLNPISSDSHCYSFAITRADDKGRFSLPSLAPTPAPLLAERERFTIAYYPGYVQPDGPTRPGIVELSKYTGNTLSRLRYLANHPFMHCVPPRRDKDALPLLLAIYGEARGIAKAEEELAILSRMRANLVIILGGEDEFRRRTEDVAIQPPPIITR